MKAIYGSVEPVTAGSAAVSRVSAPGDHGACDAEIARLRQVHDVWTKHLRTIVDALNFAAANAPYEALKSRYTEAQAGISLLAGTEGIAKYAPAGHTEPSEVRHVSSSDSAGSGDGIS